MGGDLKKEKRPASSFYFLREREEIYEANWGRGMILLLYYFGLRIMIFFFF